MAHILFLLLLSLLLIKEILSYDYYLNPNDVINYLNNKITMTEEEYRSFIKYLIQTLKESYAFYEISKNPPQPTSNYHTNVDLESELTNIDISNIQPYDFIRQVTKVLSNLKDSHVVINWKKLGLKDFQILLPIDFYLKKDDEEWKIYGNCIDDYKEFDDDDDGNLEKYCEYDYDYYPIISINDNNNPFDFINNYGGNFVATKNIHGTFSFKLSYTTIVPLSDYPFALDEFQNFKFVYVDENENEIEIDSGYFIGTNINIDSDRLRNLKGKKSKKFNYKNNEFNRKNYIKKNRRKLGGLFGNEIKYDVSFQEEGDIIFGCLYDETKEINLYYISSFTTNNKQEYIDKIKECYKFIDKNDKPIIVINELNNGGLVSLSQLFLGLISPLMSIDLYKGRIRITNTFINTDEINQFIETNLTSIDTCKSANFLELINEQVNVKYSDNNEVKLTKTFFLNNKELHDEIENLRNSTKNPRKPTDILVYTDGYSFSAASLFLKYLHNLGGGIIVGYLGNPKKKNELFDISQSASAVFPSKILEIFSPEAYKNKLEKELDCELELPGIQTFYNKNDKDIPLEYDVTEPDEKIDLYSSFYEDSYETFIQNAKDIINKYKTECNPKNKKLLKIIKDCDNKFENNYTHGGYECGNDGTWTTNCIASYCEPGYIFDQVEKKCIKDVCSSIQIPDNTVKNKTESSNNWLYIKIFVPIAFVVFVFCMVIVIIYLFRNSKKMTPITMTTGNNGISSDKNKSKNSSNREIVNSNHN